MRKIGLLVVSDSAPFRDYGKAGQKTHYYYFKKFIDSGIFDIRLVCSSVEKELEKLDYLPENIQKKCYVEKEYGIYDFIKKVKRFFSFVLFTNDRYAHFLEGSKRNYILNQLKTWKRDGYQPDIVLLEFTQVILLSEDIKEIFPNAKIVASSHDVMYVGSKRVFDFENNIIKKYFRKKQYKNLKVQEVRALSCCDLVVTQNNNDIKILKENKVLKEKKFLMVSPYYDNYSDVVRTPQRDRLIFFGAMNRKENIESVIWFAKNVFCKVSSLFELYIIGANPSKEIQELNSGKIHVTGFLSIEEIKKLMSTCTCMVAPLQLGSGIKVKVLESFSAGIPVVTNEIGIEGIFAQKSKEYLHCSTSEEYVDTLLKIANGLDIEIIGENSKSFVSSKFNKEKSADQYIEMIKKLVY